MKRTTEYRRGTAVRRLGPALALALGLAWVAAGPIAVAQDNEAQSLSSIRKVAESYVRSLIPSGPGAGESIVIVGQLDNRLRLAHCATRDLSASLPVGMTLQARSTVGVSCAGPVHWRVFVPVTVESKINVLVLNRPVNREARLTAADVSIEKRTTTGPGNAYLTSLSDLAGRTVRRPLAAGTALSVDMFSPDLVVRRGQSVTLISAGGSVEVRATGRAMTDGAAGARIQVQNMSSLRVVEGVVESADVVRVAR